MATGAGVDGTTHLRSRHLEELAELGIVELPEKGTRGVVVSLTEEWRRRLDARRELGGELAATRRQAVRHRDDRADFYSPQKADKEPQLMDREKFERVEES